MSLSQVKQAGLIMMAGVSSVLAEEFVELEPLAVFSSRVANQAPAGTFAAPVSALNYEPQVDVQSRGFSEAQADVTIRGGTFENTGFAVGGLPIYDPQTGHYSAELPVSPYLLAAPDVRVGAEQAIAGYGATSGSVAYAFRPVLRSGGVLSAGAGGDSLARGDLYLAGVAPGEVGGFTLAADFAYSEAQGDGTRKFRDPDTTPRDSGHEFARVNGRVQLRNAVSQTDFFAGYQDKKFAWPNLYAARNKTTPYRQEVENLKTKLFIVNHRTELEGDGDYIQAGAYYRGHDDFYTIPFFGALADGRHNTLVRGAALDGRQTLREGTALRYVAGVIDDKIDSNTLAPGFGAFRSRTQSYAGLFGEQTIRLAEGRELVATAGARRDDSNRDAAEWSPVARLEWVREGAKLRGVYVSYDETTQLPNYTALNNNPAGLFGGDATLPRATAQNVELGLRAELVSWHLTAAVFFRRDNELLDYVFDPANVNSSRVATAVDLDTVGVEVFARRGWERFDLFFGYSFLDKKDDYTSVNAGSFYALNYAQHRLTAAVVARLGAGFELRVDNELRHQADNPLRRRGEDKILSAMGLSYAVPMVKGLTLNAQVENLWNTYYEEVPLVPGARRAWSVGATYAW